MNHTFYEYRNKGENKTFHEEGLCFSNIYRYSDSLEYLKVYVLKDYKYIQSSVDYPCNMEFSEQDVIDYTGALNKMSLFCTLNLEDEVYIKDIDKTEQAYSFEIDCERNNAVRIKLLLNLIRFLYENDLRTPISHQEIVRYFLNFLRQDSNILFYNLLILSCLVSGCRPTGHNFIPDYTQLKCITNAEYRNVVINSKLNTDLKTMLPSSKKFSEEEQKELFLLTNNINELYKKYQEICVKYI